MVFWSDRERTHGGRGARCMCRAVTVAKGRVGTRHRGMSSDRNRSRSRGGFGQRRNMYRGELGQTHVVPFGRFEAILGQGEFAVLSHGDESQRGVELCPIHRRIRSGHRPYLLQKPSIHFGFAEEPYCSRSCDRGALRAGYVLPEMVEMVTFLGGFGNILGHVVKSTKMRVLSSFRVLFSSRTLMGSV